MNKLNILILLVVLLILQGCNNERIEIDNKRISLYDNLIPKNHFNNRYVDSLRLVYKRNGYLVGIKLYSYGRVNINMAIEFYSDSIPEILKRKSLYINTFLRLSEFEENKIIWDKDFDYIIEDYYKDTSKTNIWIRYLLFKIHKEKNLNKNKYENYNKYYNLKISL